MIQLIEKGFNKGDRPQKKSLDGVLAVARPVRPGPERSYNYYGSVYSIKLTTSVVSSQVQISLNKTKRLSILILTFKLR